MSEIREIHIQSLQQAVGHCVKIQGSGDDGLEQFEVEKEMTPDVLPGSSPSTLCTFILYVKLPAEFPDVPPRKETIGGFQLINYSSKYDDTVRDELTSSLSSSSFVCAKWDKNSILGHDVNKAFERLRCLWCPLAPITNYNKLRSIIATKVVTDDQKMELLENADAAKKFLFDHYTEIGAVSDMTSTSLSELNQALSLAMQKEEDLLKAENDLEEAIASLNSFSSASALQRHLVSRKDADCVTLSGSTSSMGLGVSDTEINRLCHDIMQLLIERGSKHLGTNDQLAKGFREVSKQHFSEADNIQGELINMTVTTQEERREFEAKLGEYFKASVKGHQADVTKRLVSKLRPEATSSNVP